MAEESVAIYHITHRQAWDQARQLGSYHGDTLATEGFIHCSTREQVIRTADLYYRGQSDLVLLCIDPARVKTEIRYETSMGGEEFPHIYGPLAITAVRQIVPLVPDQDGFFSMPSAFETL
jgi:uncharacterized protein (DUF952 family)